MTERPRGLLSNRRARATAAAMLLVLVCCIVSVILHPREPSLVPRDARWLPVQPQLLENRIGLAGRIEPATRLLITAPFEGSIEELTTAEGNRVEKGQVLVTLDTVLLDIRIREALAELLKIRRNVENIRDWDNSDEVARARRTATNAEMTLNDTKSKLADTRHLFERGIV